MTNEDTTDTRIINLAALSTQSMGGVLVTKRHLKTATHVSENMSYLTGIPASKFLTTPLTDLLSRDLLHDARNVIGLPQSHSRRSYLGHCSLNDNPLEVCVHSTNSHVMWEFFPAPPKNITGSMALQQLNTIQDELARADDIKGLLTHVCETIAWNFGFDSVYAYKTNPRSHQVAEFQKDFSTTEGDSRCSDYLNSPWLREQLRRARLFAVQDVQATPVKCLKSDEESVPDFSMSLCQYPQPKELSWLRSQQVKTSLDIALLQGNKLWGCLLCHSTVLPNPFSLQDLLMLEGLSRTLSLLLTFHTDAEEAGTLG